MGEWLLEMRGISKTFPGVQALNYEHRGIWHYTIGQRRGLGLPDATPWYVVAIDATNNRIIVGKKIASRRSRLGACRAPRKKGTW